MGESRYEWGIGVRLIIQSPQARKHWPVSSAGCRVLAVLSVTNARYLVLQLVHHARRHHGLGVPIDRGSLVVRRAVLPPHPTADGLFTRSSR